MNKMKTSNLIILGSGPAGYTAAIYASRANLNPLLITGIDKGGQLINTNEIENWPGNPYPITGQFLMDKMYEHVVKFNVEIIYDHIVKTDLKNKPFRLFGHENQYLCNSLIIATGASPRYLGIPSEDIYKGKGVSTCAICDGFFYKNKNVAVIGGGNTAIEETIFLSKIVKKVYLIHRRNKFSAEKILIEKLVNNTKNKNVIIYTNNVLEEILGNGENIYSIRIKNINKNSFTDLSVSGIFIAVGNIPNTKIFNNQLKMENGYICTKNGTNGNMTATSISGVFAAGNVTDKFYRQAITAAGSGCMAAIDAERYLEK